MVKEEVSWDDRAFCKEIIVHGDFSKLATLSSICQWEQIFYVYHSLSHEKLTMAVDYVIKNFHSFQLKQEIWHLLFKWMHEIPIISCLIVEALSVSQSAYPMEKSMYITLVHSVIQTANSGKELVLILFENLIRVLVNQSVEFAMNDITKMVKSIVFCVRHVRLCLEAFLVYHRIIQPYTRTN